MKVDEATPIAVSIVDESSIAAAANTGQRARQKPKVNDTQSLEKIFTVGCRVLPSKAEVRQFAKERGHRQ